jgi:hypothetical protein
MTFPSTVRMDYQVSPRLRLSVKWTAQNALVSVAPGSLTGWTDTIQKFPSVNNIVGTVNLTLNPTTFVEATYGGVQNRLGTPPVGQYSNRNNIVCPADLATLVPRCSMADMTFLFPDAFVIDTRYYEYKALQTIGVPFLEGDRMNLPPILSWGGVGGTAGRVSNTPPSPTFPSFMNINRTQDLAISLTKVTGRHTFKTGFYLNHSYKAQNQDGTPKFQGNLSFGADSSNPLDTSFPYANAALGIFSTFGQQSRFVEGSFLYNQADWFIQDNWKVSRNLTLDYGMRFVHQGPQYDEFLSVSTFFPEQWSKANAPALYTPGCLTTSPCTGNNRQARDPRTGLLLGAGSSSLIGQAVVGSGNVANGMKQAGDGIAKTGFTWPKLALAPRLGVAYDPTGSQKFVLRGSVGLFYDRPDGNAIYGNISNPPVVLSTTSQWGSLSALGDSRLSFGPVPTISSFYYDAKLPSDVQWNAGFQMALPWASSIDVEYVGHHSYNVLSNTCNGANASVNLNAIDLGALYLPSAQDPTQVAGTVLNTNLLRPYQGYNDVKVYWPRFHRTYHSIQTAYNRRFRNGISLGSAWTLGLSDKGNTQPPGVALRLDHAADGTFKIRDDQATAEELFADQNLTRHIVQSTFIWDLPDVRGAGAWSRVIGGIVNDWQLSGIFKVDSGGPYDVSYSYQTGGGNALTGSPNYTARIVIPDLDKIGSGCGSRYSQFSNQMVAGGSNTGFPLVSPVFSGPQANSVGLESGRNLLHGCGNRTLDLAISRTIRLGGGRSVQLRADIFNAPNAVMINARSTTIQFNSPTDLTVRNSQFLPDGTLDPNRLRPNQAGFGAASGARDPRTIQLQARFSF